ncbi:MAG: response regulator transcription factor [Acidobacteria bacterium]|nr:response regulator transcription factor [Acidobacteriota bacterium]
MAAAIHHQFSTCSPGVRYHRIDGIEAVLIHETGEYGAVLDSPPLEICRQLHASRPELAVFVVAPAAPPDLRVALLEAGADEVLNEPIGEPELEARLRALVRRCALLHAPPNLRIGDIELDLSRGRVFRRGHLVAIPAKEFLLLRFLAQNPGTVFSRAALLLEVWGYRSSFTRTVDVHIAMLRQRVEDNPHKPRYIQTVRGRGYRLTIPAEEPGAAAAV